MKKITVVLLVVVLTGCAATGKKKDTDIYQEALTAVAMDSGTVQPKIMTIKIPSHGLIPDQLAIALGGGANAGQLREVLISLKRTSNNSALIMGDNPALDYAVIANAVKELDLTGVKIVYSNKNSKRTQIEQAVKKAGAAFYFISQRS